MNLLLADIGSRVVPYIILAVYMLSMVGIAFYSRRKTKTLNDFFLAGRGMGGWMSAFAYGTTYFSSVIFIGYAGKFGWNIGISSIFIGLGNALIGSLLAWKILAKRTRDVTHTLGASTMPEFFEKRFESKGLRLMSSIIIFVFLIPYSASVYQGLAYLFEMVFGIPFIWCVIIMASVTALYLFFGGYLATALSDFVQGIIMIVGVIVMVVLLLNRPEVNWGEGFAKLSEMGLGIIPKTGGGWNSPMFNLIILILLTSFGIWGMPQSVHKFYAIKDDKAINKAMIISTLFCALIGIGAYLTGALAPLFLDAIPQGNYDLIVPVMLAKVLPASLLGLIVVLVLSASMSTLSSLSLAGASSIAVDAYKGFIRPNAEDKKVKMVLKICCLMFVVVSVVLAIVQFDAIVTLMSLSWGALAGCFIGPYVWGLYSKKITKTAVYASMISGLTLTFGLVIVFGLISPNKNIDNAFMAMVKGGIARSPLIGVICMAFSAIITPIVSLFTKKPSEELLEKI
ncbi:MAG: sodium:solute symporter [Clostridia bacterium]